MGVRVSRFDWDDPLLIMYYYSDFGQIDSIRSHWFLSFNLGDSEVVSATHWWLRAGGWDMEAVDLLAYFSFWTSSVHSHSLFDSKHISHISKYERRILAANELSKRQNLGNLSPAALRQRRRRSVIQNAKKYMSFCVCSSLLKHNNSAFGDLFLFKR